MQQLIEDMGIDRVIFGSDYPWEEPGRARSIIEGLDLSPSEKEDLLWRNAALLLGEQPLQ